MARTPGISSRARSSKREAVASGDGMAVRRYLRSLVGAPLRGAADPSELEADFVAAAAPWAARAGVDRQTLAGIGVPRRVLDRAGVARATVAERLRRHWDPDPFTIADLARRSGIAESAVRQAVADEERTGSLIRTGRDGRTILYGRAK